MWMPFAVTGALFYRSEECVDSDESEHVGPLSAEAGWGEQAGLTITMTVTVTVTVTLNLNYLIVFNHFFHALHWTDSIELPEVKSIR